MVKHNKVIQATQQFVKNKMMGEGSGHDWWHIVRVLKNAQQISAKEGGDSYVIELAALLHDIADWKFHGGDTTIGPKVASEWLRGQKVDDEIIEQVAYIIEHISFKGGTNMHKMRSLEGKIVQDADRLDALGAIGIARVFAYGGAHTREIHNPTNKPLQAFSSFKTYQKAMKNSTSINHFYEKLLRVKDHMNTAAGKKLALHRHKFMEKYLAEFYDEWDGKK